MATYVRGYNPIWLFDDLNGMILDDTYYLFILQNTIPYLPALDIYQDSDGNVNWSTPIQFLANGTLPNNVYFNPSSVYRLEVRQGSTQADPLIYLIENYVPGTDVVPPGGTGNVTDNQITNPQFANVLFDPNLSLVINSATTTPFAPGWSVITSGSGTLTITQQEFAGTDNVPGNASYGITLSNAGFTTVTVVQRFNNNGELWTTGSVSLGGVGYVTGASSTDLLGTIVYSDGQSQQIFNDPINAAANVFGNVSDIPQSTNASAPGVSYTECQLEFAGSLALTLTNIQLIGDALAFVDYAQITIERQIDQQYHWDLPIVPVGTVIDYYGFGAPNHFLLCDGSTYSRNKYYKLFAALTLIQNIVEVTNVTFTCDATKLGIGMYVEGAGIPVGTYITLISAYAPGATITVNQVTTSTGTFSARFFAAGQGDGSTTFSTPDLQGYVIAGIGGASLFLAGTPPNTLGADVGSSTYAMIAANIPQHTHKTIIPTSGGGASGQAFNATSNISTNRTYTTDGGESLANVPLTTPPTAFSLVQPTTFAYKYIRYE